MGVILLLSFLFTALFWGEKNEPHLTALIVGAAFIAMFALIMLLFAYGLIASLLKPSGDPPRAAASSLMLTSSSVLLAMAFREPALRYGAVGIALIALSPTVVVFGKLIRSSSGEDVRSDSDLR